MKTDRGFIFSPFNGFILEPVLFDFVDGTDKMNVVILLAKINEMEVLA